MSWSASFPNGVRGSAVDEDLADDRAAISPPQLDKEPREQFDQARELASSLLASGCVGDGEKTFNVSLSGHANPGHLPAHGWANDMVSVSVSQR